MVIKMMRCPECGKKYSRAESKLTPYFNLCPYCGELFNKSKRAAMAYFNLTGAGEIELLRPSFTLIKKGELTAAARQALITLEEHVRSVSGLKKMRGRDLMFKAFSFQWDGAKNQITQRPVIAVNDLRTESKRNEQDGILHIAVGLMAGARNILAHHGGKTVIGNALYVVAMVVFVIEHISGENTKLSDIS